MKSKLTLGDFTGLAKDYSSSRPDYSEAVIQAITGLLPRPINNIDFVDVGAGTGIWTRMIDRLGVSSSCAIEPNFDMRNAGTKDSSDRSISWREGSAEETGLPDACCDWVSMASSFHWADFDLATKEFHRILRSNGIFTAVWNPRLVEVNPLLLRIENKIREINPNVKRVSSGRSEFTERLFDRLANSKYFNSPVYVEGRHVIRMSKNRYLSAWRSVNDLRVQLGGEGFEYFLTFVESEIGSLEYIDATYLTRSWTARRKGEP